MDNKTILHYRLTERIGAGGMGVVWKALDTHLDREVALKFLPEAATSDRLLRERFFREAKAASALNHPNIVTIFDVNSEAGQIFIAMELVHGRALSDVLRGHRRLSPQVAVDYAIQLCEGLGAAHRAGIVHRDIKPSNIMVTPSGLIKILDFGLAKRGAAESDAVAREGGFVESLTATGAVVGTVPYMSPEQVGGDGVGMRSDVFSAGTVLYEMLSGQRPFQGSSNAEILRAVLGAEPAPLLSSAPGLPAPLVRIVHKCLQKDPAERYGDAGGVAKELRSLDRGSWPSAVSDRITVTIGPPGTSAKAARKRWGLLGGSVTLFLLVVALLAGYKLSPAVHSILSIRSVPGTADALQTAHAYLERYDRKGNVDRAIAALETGLPRAQSDPALQASLAEAYVRKYGEAPEKQWLDKAVASGRKAVAADPGFSAGHVALGMALAVSGQKGEASAQFERGRDLDPRNGRTYLGLSKLRSGSEAEQLHHAAVQYSPGDWIPESDLGTFYYVDALYDESIAAWRRALQLTPDNVKVMAYLAAGFHMKGQYADVADISQKALAIDATSAAAWANLATARYFQGRYIDAAGAAEKAVEFDRGRYLYWGNLGDNYRWAEGMGKKADDAYREAIRLTRARLAVNAGDLGLRSSLAVYLAKSGDKAGALAELARIQVIPESDKNTLFKAAMVYEVCGQRKQALEALGRAIRAGYSMHETANDPELAKLRSDPGYVKLAGLATAR